MTKFRLLLVVLCLGLLGVMPFVTSQPKPETTEPAAARETAVQRQMAAQQQAPLTQEILRPQVGGPLTRVSNLVSAGEYQQAFTILDSLDALPDVTDYERSTIGQMRNYATVKSSGLQLPQAR